MDRVTGIILSIIALLVLCGCCLVVCAGLAAGVMFMADQPGDSGYGYAPLSNAGATPEVIRPDGPQSTPVPQDTRLTLEQSVVPVNDMLDLARRLARFILKPSMWEDTSAEGYPGHEHGVWAGHWHGNVTTLFTLLRLAILDGDERLKQIVREADPAAFVVVTDTREVMGNRIGNQPPW